MRIFSGALSLDGGDIRMGGSPVRISSPIEAHHLGIEMVFQDLASLNTLAAVDDLFLGRELSRRVPVVRLNDVVRMRRIARGAVQEITPNFDRSDVEVGLLSGCQRQSISIARAVRLDTRVLLMDEPAAALGPEATEMVRRLVRRLKARGISIFIIGPDLQDVIALSDRIVAMRGERIFGTVAAATEDDLRGMIISGKCPMSAEPGPGPADRI